MCSWAFIWLKWSSIVFLFISCCASSKGRLCLQGWTCFPTTMLIRLASLVTPFFEIFIMIFPVLTLALEWLCSCLCLCTLTLPDETFLTRTGPHPFSFLARGLHSCYLWSFHSFRLSIWFHIFLKFLSQLSSIIKLLIILFSIANVSMYMILLGRSMMVVIMIKWNLTPFDVSM